MKQSASSPATQGFSILYLIMCITFCICLVVANLVEIKTIDVGPFTITAGLIVFPISYIINDCVVEVYGFRKARLMIWLGFAVSLFVALMLQLSIVLPGGEQWTLQNEMSAIYGVVPRIMGASFLAFLCGSMVNAYVMSRMKVADKGRHFSFRAIVSTIFGEGIDSIIFFPIAFGGILDFDVILSLILTQTLLKTLYEIIILPVTLVVVRRLKRAENIDTVDHNISYKWWKINEI